jgi:hypothetical protein
MISDGDDHGEDFAYQAPWGAVFGRWRKGIDLEPLIELLQSEKSGERERGAYYLEEAGPPAEAMADFVINLADDASGDCRWKFVAYVTNSGLYSDHVVDRLAACLLDRDLYVRKHTISWAVSASDEQFTQFTEAVLVVADSRANRLSILGLPEQAAFRRESERKRAQRGLDIARRLRAGDTVETIRASTPEEDNFTFDQLASRERRLKRHHEWKVRQDKAGRARARPARDITARCEGRPSACLAYQCFQP